MSGFRVWGSEFTFQGSGFRVGFQGSGFRVQSLGVFRFQVSGIRVYGSEFRLQGSGFGFRLQRLGFRVQVWVEGSKFALFRRGVVSSAGFSPRGLQSTLI